MLHIHGSLAGRPLPILLVSAVATPAGAALQVDTWLEEQQLTAAAPETEDRFGSALALWDDTLAVGAPGEDRGPDEDTGAVHVFARTPAGWTFRQRIFASDRLEGDFFGQAIALEEDLMVVGVGERNEPGAPNAGAAYVFIRVDDVWIEQEKLTADVVQTNDLFGESVAIQGSTLLVGAFADDDDLFSSGSVFVFERQGMDWVQVQKLTIGSPAAGSFFGRSLAFDGDTATVGAHRYQNDRGVPVLGGVFAYERSGSVFGPHKLLLPDTRVIVREFGWDVALDGDLMLASAPGDVTTGVDPGPVVVFARRESVWTQAAELEPPPGAEAGHFGQALALHGRTALVGATEVDDVGVESGACYVFERFDGAWHWTDTLRPAELASGDHLGSALTFERNHGARLALGTPHDDHSAVADAGSATVFERVPVFDPSCSGDGRAGDCPCANAGSAGHGCANGSFASGARLWGQGSTSVALDEARLRVASATPLEFGMFVHADSVVDAGTPFGDGLLCLAGELLELEVQQADANGELVGPPDLAGLTGAAPGDATGFQWWYRDSRSSPCGTGFNLSNALLVRWIP